MRRREFLAALGGAAAASAWPLAAGAQQKAVKVWRVGYLSPSSAVDIVGVANFDAFRLKLQELGYVEGKNLTLDLRRAEGDFGRLSALADELVSLSPNVIGGSGPTIAALQRATSSIPIVMATSTAPIRDGFIKSLAKPGGNITGLTSLSGDLTAKSLEFLHVAIPNAKRVAVLMSPNPSHQAAVNEAYAAAGNLGLTLIPVMARTLSDLDDAFAMMRKEGCDAVVVLGDSRIVRKIVELADAWRLPAIYQIPEFMDMGGLLSYGPNGTEHFRQAAIFVDKILKGASPADLPVEQPTRFELQLNLKAAKVLGLTIPDTILVRADKVIE